MKIRYIFFAKELAIVEIGVKEGRIVEQKTVFGNYSNSHIDDYEQFFQMFDSYALAKFLLEEYIKVRYAAIEEEIEQLDFAVQELLEQHK